MPCCCSRHCERYNVVLRAEADNLCCAPSLSPLPIAEYAIAVRSWRAPHQHQHNTSEQSRHKQDAMVHAHTIPHKPPIPPTPDPNAHTPANPCCTQQSPLLARPRAPPASAPSHAPPCSTPAASWSRPPAAMAPARQRVIPSPCKRGNPARCCLPPRVYRGASDCLPNVKK